MAGDYSTVTIKGDNTDLKDVLDECADFFKEFGDRVKQAIFVIAGVVAFEELIGKIKGGIKAFEESEEALRHQQYALKSTGEAAGFTADQLKQMTAELQKLGNYSEDEFTQAQTALLRFTNVRMDIYTGAIKGAMDLAAAVGGTLGSAVVTLGSALNDPLEGLQKLKDEGVVFTKSQERLIMAFLRFGKVAEAQKIMLDALASTYGGAGAQKAQTFSDRLEKLNEASNKIWKTIGEMLVPYLNKFIDAVEFAGRVVDNFAKTAWAEFQKMGGGISITLEDIKGWLLKFADAMVQAFSFVQAAVEEWRSFFTGGWEKIKEVTFSTLASIIERLMQWFEMSKSVWQKIVEIAGIVWLKILEGAKFFFEKASEYWAMFAKYVQGVWNNMLTNAAVFWFKLRNIMSGNDEAAAVAKFVDLFENPFKKVTAELPKAWGEMKFPKIPGAEDMVKDLRKAAEEAKRAADAALDPFSKTFKDDLEKNRKRFQDMLDYLAKLGAADPYKDITGKDSKKPFDLNPADKSKEGENRTAGGIEDLIALNKRISAAAAKPPDLKELEEQTRLAKQQRDALILIARNTMPVQQPRRHQGVPVGRFAGPGDGVGPFQGGGF